MNRLYTREPHANATEMCIPWLLIVTLQHRVYRPWGANISLSPSLCLESCRTESLKIIPTFQADCHRNHPINPYNKTVVRTVWRMETRSRDQHDG